ncbi:hypothetical protein CKF43_14335 [Pantoea graminicola]|nr:hypothetical protein CKF43_14335 [Pantoea sp. ARC607]
MRGASYTQPDFFHSEVIMIRILKLAAILALVTTLSGCLFPPPGGGGGWGGHGGGPGRGFIDPR